MNKVKFFYSLAVVLLMSCSAYSQEQSSGSTFFGQCMIDVESDEDLKRLEADMRQNPYLKMVRLDLHTRRAFVLTNGIASLTEEEFSSWFNENAEALYCIQIGRYGVDAMKPFPFEDCVK